MIGKARKKPVVIEYAKWTGKNFLQVQSFAPGIGFAHKQGELPVLKIHTLEGIMDANVGDYIIKGVNGEFYPCKPDIFLKDDGPSVDDGPVAVTSPPSIYTAPTPATQRPVNSNARDRKNHKRHITGGVIAEKGKR